MRMLIITFIMILLVVPFLLAGVLICPDCGTEYGPEDKICRHCHKVLPDRDVHAKPEPSDGNNADNALVLTAVEDDLVSVDAAIRDGEIDLARLFLANAIALLLLAGEGETNLEHRISSLARICEQQIRSGVSVCPVCGGTGKAYLQTRTLTNSTNIQVIAGQTCHLCQGKGKIVRNITAVEQLASIAEAKRKFASAEITRRRVPLGGVWLPGSLDGKLSDRQIAMIRRAVPPPCPKCGGTGKIDCRICHGTGTVPCQNKGCVNGKVQVRFEGLSGTTFIRHQKCPVCDGTSLVTCSACGGTGGNVCSVCHGDGKAPVCQRCGGQGTIVCSSCGGTGTTRNGLCQACGGDGVKLCPTCHGDGRK